MENKKVKNASLSEYKGIKFKSDLEKDCYILLQGAGFNPLYEGHTFHLWKGKKFAVPCYDEYKDRKTHKKTWGINPYKPVDIKYTPDFVFSVTSSSGSTIPIVIEAKGYPNDRYPYVKKLFRSWLEKHKPDAIFFEVHNKKQIKAAIEVIKSL